MCCVPRGLTATQCTIVGNKLGEKDVKAAKLFNKHIILFGMVAVSIVILSVYLTLEDIQALFTHRLETKKVIFEVFPIQMLSHALDSAQMTQCGTIRALGL